MREAPNDFDTERHIIGACLLYEDASEVTLTQLRVTDFYSLKHRTIYTAISSIHARQEPVDLTTVSNELRKKNKGEKSYSVYLVECTELVVSSRNVDSWCKIIREKSALRQIINGTEILLDGAYKGEEPAHVLIEKAETHIMNANVGNTGDSFDSISNASDSVMEDIDTTMRGDKQFVISGYNELDNMLHGFVDSNLYIVAGRPGMGKTALAMNIAENVGATKTVGFMSMEMSKEQLAERLIFSTAKVSIAHSKPTFDNGKMIPPMLTAKENEALLKAKGTVSKLKIEIDDTPALDIKTLRSKAKQLKSKCGIEILIVDYIQLMNGVGNNRTEAVGEISRGLKIIAKELHIPVIALSQLSRALETRTDRRPILSDLRDSGAIEQDADAVLFVYREEMYMQHLDRENPKRKLVEGMAEIVVGKNRHGKTGIVNLAWLGDRTRFENLKYMPPS